MRKFLILIGLLCSAGLAFGQAAVQQSAVRMDASTTVGFIQGTSTQTLTITPPGGQYVYLTAIGIDACENGTGTALTNANVTTGGTGGIIGSPSWSFSLPVGNVSTCVFGSSGSPTNGYAGISTAVAERFPTPLRSGVPGGTVTFSTPAATNVTYNIRAYYYFAP